MTRCLGCRANVTNLSLIPIIDAHAAKHPVQDVWEMSTYGATLAFLRQRFSNVISSEFFPGIASGALVSGVLAQDVQRLSLADESVDLITSNQVFEHVEDDSKGYAECYRVLRPGGALIFSVPLYDIPTTLQLARVEEGKLEHLETPEYHDSRLGGPGSALCFWRHSFHDISARVARLGFNTRLEEVRLPRSAAASTYVIYAEKPTK